MVKHIVMWKLLPEAEGADRKTNAIKIKRLLEKLNGVVPGAYSLEVGINYNPGGYDVVLYSEFNDNDALQNYQIHPQHMKVKEFIHKVISDRVVADYVV